MNDDSAREGASEDQPLLLTRADAAKLLGVSLSTFLRHVAPKLKPIKIGRLVRFARADVEAWAEKRGAPLWKEAAQARKSTTAFELQMSPEARAMAARLRQPPRQYTPEGKVISASTTQQESVRLSRLKVKRRRTS